MAEPLNKSVNSVKDIHFQLFKIDSAMGNYVSAIDHFEISKKLQDSIFNEVKTKEVNRLQIAYETSAKEKSIIALQSRSRAQTEEIHKTSLEKNIIFGVTVLLIIIAALSYNGYRNKRKGNLALQSKQLKINLQNESLQALVQEKEWLLKEVHHRVKNNLQIVMSLLSSQSAYLQNNAAIEAIHDSQNRVQAISLIHQKLYTSSNLASIGMSVYVADLISYLSESFDVRSRNIKFEQNIESFNLDLGQAVPIGLIINESVTNAIKYAFDTDGGLIKVALQLVENEMLSLTIIDNGNGLPDSFKLENTTTLGMEMMKALSKQLGGVFNVENSSGVKINIKFHMDKISESALEKV
ncbi:sensor histidine kinase [Mucilaginibacter antarcticus]|uniref:sensor histidine kinase n=1 Tax=Mucilaginibacter antarcticus TaxID=1855725 RepID=UPI003628B552